MENYKQLQEAYDQGYYDQLKEDPAGLFRVLKKAIGIGTGAGKRVVRTDIPAGVIPSQFNWGSNQGWQDFMDAMNDLFPGNIGNSSRFRALVMFISNPTVKNLQILNDILIQWGIRLGSLTDGGILTLLRWDPDLGQYVALTSNDLASSPEWITAIFDLFDEWNIPWPPPGP